MKIDKERRVQTDENKDRCISFNFASSCYHRYYYYLSERFFKFEAFFSTSIESLLTLFAVVFTFSCQTIVVKSMFNSYQIDLSLRNSSFIHISSVSFSFIIFSTVRYMIFMLVSKFSETLHFNKYHITEFLERFEKQCDEYEIIEKNN